MQLGIEVLVGTGAKLGNDGKTAEVMCRAAADGSNAWTAGVVTAHFAQADL